MTGRCASDGGQSRYPARALPVLLGGLIVLASTVPSPVFAAEEVEPLLEEIPEAAPSAPTEEPLTVEPERPPPSDASTIAPSPAAPKSAAVVFGGYVDFGFFVPESNGAGWIQATTPTLMRSFPQYVNRYSWVFLGDILAPAVNSRGEPADLGDAPGVTRFDSVNSNGALGFIVNEVNLTANAALLSNVLATTSLNLTPRTGSHFSWGDVFDVDIAQIEWLLGARQRTSIFIGKIDSVIGIEYRERKASQRFGITPSLLARYTTGTPLGLKVRTKLGANEQLVLAASLTNGSSVIEPFHFFDEIDSNDGKTASGRIAWRPPLPFELELGLSGLRGAQDRALDSRHDIWFWGVDLLSQIGPVALKGQWLQGGARGETDRRYSEEHRPYGLALHGGAYLELNAMMSPWLGLLARGEYRDAQVTLGAPGQQELAERLYLTMSWRATIGARIAFSDSLFAKAEYLWNGEYGGVPHIPNNVFTTSCVWTY